METETVIAVIETLTLAVTENMFPLCLKHCLVVGLAIGVHVGVASATDRFVGGTVGFAVGLEDGAFVVGARVGEFVGKLVGASGKVGTAVVGVDEGASEPVGLMLGSDVVGFADVGLIVGLRVGI